jgi:hypothetical protein
MDEASADRRWKASHRHRYSDWIGSRSSAGDAATSHDPLHVPHAVVCSIAVVARPQHAA